MDEFATDIRIVAASLDEKPLLGRLLQLYLHDFSEFAEIRGPHGDIGDDGLFDYESFDSYWEQPKREPLLLCIGRRTVGFALISDWSASGRSTDRSVAEFFVMRKYRRAKLGTRFAKDLIMSRPGTWEVPVASYNQPAQAFWRSVVRVFQPLPVSKLEGDGIKWRGPIFRLVVPQPISE